MKKIERIACYVRVSSTEQKLHGLSLDAQKMKLIAYAKKHGMKIVGWYCDEGVSARKLIKNRPELQRLIHDAEEGKFERIIFIKLDRFFRSVAEYHECMKRIAPVVWSTTEEEYDLTTANGRMLVNMKLTIAELEADMTGERITIVNDYKTSTGQPLTGSMPFGFMISKDANTGRKKIVRDPDEEPILRDALQHFMTHQSKRKTIQYLNAKHHISMGYNTLSNLLTNTMLYGAYRDNPSYCEAYIDKGIFDKIQGILKRNCKENTAENRVYLFTGMIKCPECGRLLAGGINHRKRGNNRYQYKKYRCPKIRTHCNCNFVKSVSQNTLERMLLENIEKYFEEAKIRSADVSETDETRVMKYDIDSINEQIDRLNYSWQTGKIRTVEQYDKDYEALMEKLALAESERKEVAPKDFSKIEAILSKGWKDIYNALDDEHKKAFWRSFIASIEIEWTTDAKAIKKVNFF